MNNFETFWAEYCKQYRAAVAAKPDDFPLFNSGWKIDDVLRNARVALMKGTLSKDGPAFKATLKALKIKNTWLAIDAYLGPIDQRGAGQ